MVIDKNKCLCMGSRIIVYSWTKYRGVRGLLNCNPSLPRIQEGNKERCINE